MIPKKYQKEGEDMFKSKIKTQVKASSITSEKDVDAIRELKLYEENESKIYERKMYMYKNLANKIAQEKYNSTKAIKMFDMLVTDITKLYEKEFGDTFDKDVKKGLAKDLRDEFEQFMLYDEFDFTKLYKQYQKEGQEVFDEKIKKQIKASKVTAFDQGNVDELILWTDNDEGLYNIKMEVYDTLLNDVYDEQYAVELFKPIAEYASELTDWDISEEDIKQIAIELAEQFESENDITAKCKASLSSEDQEIFYKELDELKKQFNDESTPQEEKNLLERDIAVYEDFIKENLAGVYAFENDESYIELMKDNYLTESEKEKLTARLIKSEKASRRKPSRRTAKRIHSASVKSLEKTILDRYPKTSIQLFDKSDKESKAIDIGYIVPDPESNEFMGGSWGQLSHMLDDVVRWAHKNNYILVTTPDYLPKDKASFKGGKKKLMKLYKEHKFIPNRGKNKDFRFKETMIKVPKDKVYAQFKAFATLVATNNYNRTVFGGDPDLKVQFEKELKINADLIYKELAPKYKKDGMEAFLIKADKIITASKPSKRSRRRK